MRTRTLCACVTAAAGLTVLACWAAVAVPAALDRQLARQACLAEARIYRLDASRCDRRAGASPVWGL